MRKLLNLLFNLCVPVLMITPGTASAQPGAKEEILTTEDGLSQGMVHFILQDREGFLWIATKDGLNRYDGYGFKVFSHDPYNPWSISGNNINLLLEDSKGRIWAYAENVGLNVYNKKSGRFHRIQLGKNNTSGIANIGLAEVDALHFLVSTHDRLYLLTLPDDFFEKNAPLDLNQIEVPGNVVAGFAKDSLGNYWISGNENNLYRLDIANRKLTKADAGYLPKNFSKQKCLFGCGNMQPDRSGIFWLGTMGYGLSKTNPNTSRFRHLGPGHSILSMAAKNDNSILATTFRYRFFQFDAPPGSGSANELFHSNISGSYGVKLAPTRSGGFWASHVTIFYHFPPFANPEIFPSEALLQSAEKANSTNQKLTIENFRIESIVFESRGGNVFFAGANGALLSLDPKTGKVVGFDYSDPNEKSASTITPTVIYEDSKGVYWMGTQSGFVRAQPTRDGRLEFAWYRNNADEGGAVKPGLSYNHVSCFLDDPANPDRYIWIATKGGGLNRLDKTTGNFHYLTTKDGLPNNTVYGILSDDVGNIWGSTNRGVFCLSRHSNLSNPTFRNFTQKDGLQDTEFNTNAYAKLPNGNLAFGGVNGLTVFNPKEVLLGEFSPNVFITNILVNNEPVVPGDASGVLTQTIETTSSITLTHLQDILTLEFASLDFTSPEQNKYRYQLVGADDKWVESGARRSATYLHLPASNYTFRVQGSNSRGIWSEHIAELKIRVLPPWWRTWWAYLLYVLAAGGLIVFIRKRELQEREVKHRLELEKIEGERLKELDSFKSRLYTNLTHEFRTPLTVILGMAQQTKMEIGTSLIPNLDVIERNGKSLLQLINQLLDLSKLDNNALQLHLEQQDIVPFLRYVTEAFQTYANSKNLSVRFFSNFEALTMDFDPEQVKQVLTNLISNAVKFTPSGGDVLVKLEMEKSKNEKLKVSVTDTGVGIAEKDLPHVFDRFFQADSSSTRRGEGTGIGLAHALELVKLMGGSIEVKSGIGKGSTFMVSLPIQRSPLTPKVELNPLSTVEDFSNWHSAESDESGTPTGDNYPLVLLIEDNADVVNYLKSCLAGKYRTLVARNGKIGVEMALEHIPDLLISDVMMPEMDGYEVCDALKNNELTSHIPILILTAKADAASRMIGLRRGADAYLSKPFDLEELLVQLEVLLSNQRRIAAHFSKALKADAPIIAPEPAIADAALVEDAFVQKVKAVIEAHFSDEDFALPQLCQKTGMSRSQLFRKLKAVTDTSPSDLIRSYRLNKAKTLLETTSLTVSEVAWQVGFKNLGHFSQSYLEEFGHSPSATRK